MFGNLTQTIDMLVIKTYTSIKVIIGLKAFMKHK